MKRFVVNCLIPSLVIAISILVLLLHLIGCEHWPPNNPTPTPGIMPTSTPPKPIPTPTPKPYAPDVRVVIRVTNIPPMSLDPNSPYWIGDEEHAGINKQCLFCLKSADNRFELAVFHRWLWREHAYKIPPGYETAPGWPTSKLELIKDGIEPYPEEHIFATRIVSNGVCLFGIGWNASGAWYRNLTDSPGHRVHLDMPGVHFEKLCEDADCLGWDSQAKAEIMQWN